MKILAMMAMAVVLGAGARADEVTVYVQGLSVVPGPVLVRAQEMANEILAVAGVKIDWREGEPSRLERGTGHRFVIGMDTGKPEITHMLQETCRHSDTGFMKARWTHQDHMDMKMKPLSFTEEDVQLIRTGLAKRANPLRLRPA